MLNQGWGSIQVVLSNSTLWFLSFSFRPVFHWSRFLSHSVRLQLWTWTRKISLSLPLCGGGGGGAGCLHVCVHDWLCLWALSRLQKADTHSGPSYSPFTGCLLCDYGWCDTSGYRAASYLLISRVFFPLCHDRCSAMNQHLVSSSSKEPLKHLRTWHKWAVIQTVCAPLVFCTSTLKTKWDRLPLKWAVKD